MSVEAVHDIALAEREAKDHNLVAQHVRQMKDMQAVIRSHLYSIYAEAIGAALWGAFRHEKLAAQGNLSKAA